MSGICECGCGKPIVNPRYRFRLGHQGYLGGIAANAPHADADDRAVAYYTGAADARNHRPRQVDIADTSTIGERYTAGYDSLGGAA